MKKQLVNALARVGFLSAIALVTAVGSAQGQSLSSKIRVNIPFDFTVADKTMPAGKYSIGRVEQTVGDSLVRISRVDGRADAIRLTSPVQNRDFTSKGAVVFHRYGNQYFLFQIWPAGTTTGRVLSKSRSEREIERKLAARAGKPTKNANVVGTVTVVGGLQ